MKIVKTADNTAYTLRAYALALRDIRLRRTPYMLGTLGNILLVEYDKELNNFCFNFIRKEVLK